MILCTIFFEFCVPLNISQTIFRCECKSLVFNSISAVKTCILKYFTIFSFVHVRILTFLLKVENLPMCWCFYSCIICNRSKNEMSKWQIQNKYFEIVSKRLPCGYFLLSCMYEFDLKMEESTWHRETRTTIQMTNDNLTTSKWLYRDKCNQIEYFFDFIIYYYTMKSNFGFMAKLISFWGHRSIFWSLGRVIIREVFEA